jgi:hypothetical protein
MIIRRAKRESSVVDWMEKVSDNQYTADAIISTVLFPSYSETDLEEMSGDLPEADFGTTSSESA